MGRTGKVLYGIRSYAVDFVCTTCRNEPFGMDGCRSFGYMGIRNTCFLGNMVERGGAEIQEDNDNRFGDWGISVDNDRLCPFQLKAASANGRLLMWKISCLAIAESPVVGHGADGFVSAYGRAQEEYFANGEYSETEELVAGSPEYALMNICRWRWNMESLSYLLFY